MVWCQCCLGFSKKIRYMKTQFWGRLVLIFWPFWGKNRAWKARLTCRKVPKKGQKRSDLGLSGGSPPPRTRSYPGSVIFSVKTGIGQNPRKRAKKRQKKVKNGQKRGKNDPKTVKIERMSPVQNREKQWNCYQSKLFFSCFFDTKLERSTQCMFSHACTCSFPLTLNSLRSSRFTESTPSKNVVFTGTKSV